MHGRAWLGRERPGPVQSSPWELLSSGCGHVERGVWERRVVAGDTREGANGARTGSSPFNFFPQPGPNPLCELRKRFRRGLRRAPAIGGSRHFPKGRGRAHGSCARPRSGGRGPLVLSQGPIRRAGPPKRALRLCLTPLEAQGRRPGDHAVPAFPASWVRIRRGRSLGKNFLKPQMLHRGGGYCLSCRGQVPRPHGRTRRRRQRRIARPPRRRRHEGVSSWRI